ncbi:MAG: hypothetical protein IPP48_09145 [Chitinophagaceae bacterium]|nr:hypothetical protein [Chitinophagaceae bacterium]
MIGVFVNTKSGKGEAVKITALIKDNLSFKNIPFTIYEDDNWPVHTQNLSEAWIVGGDGTLNYFINKYREILIPLAIFKGGTGNDVAWKLYGNLTTQQQIALVLSTNPKQIDAAMCNDKLFINGVGIGFDGEVLKSMSAIRWLGGHIGYLLVVIKKIFSFKEFSFTIQSSQINKTEKYLLVNIANASRTGGGFYISPLADVADGKLNVVLCKPLSVLKRLKYLPVIEKGKHLSLPFVTHQLVEEIKIEMPTSVFAQLDGELIEAKSFSIKILKQKFSFKC